MQSWSQEDEVVWKSLRDGAFIGEEEPRSLLSVVNAARAYERLRIQATLLRVSEPLTGVRKKDFLDVCEWLERGAPDHDPR